MLHHVSKLGPVAVVVAACNPARHEVPADAAIDTVDARACEQCDDPCSAANLGLSYVGCDYYPTVTANTVSVNFDFAVAVSNTWTDTAIVTVEGGALASPVMFSVPPGEVGVRNLPWVGALKGCESTGIECQATTTSIVAPKGAYHLHSDRPVTVYQFNPLEYHQNFAYSTTNDASLLLPTNTLGTEYVAATWPAWTSGWTRPGVVAITATTDATSVTVTTTAAVAASGSVPAFVPGVPTTVSLDTGDVLELFAYDGDLTGTRVQADHPVQVIAGHFCTDVPSNVYACDHLEDAMFPVATLADEYLVSPPAAPGFPDGRAEVVRIVAAEGPTTLMFDPPIAASTTLAQRGSFIEIANTTQSFRVMADHKIEVAQYMTGQGDSTGVGDPSLALAVAVAQFRTRYVFHAPTTYDSNYVTAVAPMTASLAVDGAPIGALTPIGASGYGVAHVQLQLTLDGGHEMTGDQPFGLSVYGYGDYTSYWYPAGLDLSVIQ